VEGKAMMTITPVFLGLEEPNSNWEAIIANDPMYHDPMHPLYDNAQRQAASVGVPLIHIKESTLSCDKGKGTQWRARTNVGMVYGSTLEIIQRKIAKRNLKPPVPFTPTNKYPGISRNEYDTPF
jgi:hypothetical protein